MTKNKIVFTLAGFVFAATCAAYAQAAPPRIQCTGNRDAVSLGQAQNRFDLPKAVFDGIDDNEDAFICCKVVGNELSNCQDNR